MEDYKKFLIYRNDSNTTTHFWHSCWCVQVLKAFSDFFTLRSMACTTTTLFCSHPIFSAKFVCYVTVIFYVSKHSFTVTARRAHSLWKCSFHQNQTVSKIKPHLICYILNTEPTILIRQNTFETHQFSVHAPNFKQFCCKSKAIIISSLSLAI